ncbi:MAG: FAD-dependent oxidoreductase [Hyphomicrobiales bacterium]|nr:FAD-dependent oxidoreductase [Hyphomicrobiales bacterium]
MRLDRPNVRPVPEAVQFRFDGRTIAALPGESIAAALAANGIAALRKADVRGDSGEGWRGVYCGMGSCFDCLVTVDGRAHQRACLRKVSGGEDVRSTPPSGSVDDRLAPLAAAPAGEALPERETDVLVIGAGPAGLGAALAARQSGAAVIVLDERGQSGGQFYKPVAPSHQVDAPPDRQFRDGARLVAATRDAGAEIIQDALVWGAFRADEVLAMIGGESVVFRPKRLILATGAFERAMPIPGWTLPGVMTTGAAQTLGRAYNVAPGQRVVIAGNGPLNFQLAAELCDRGVDVVALVESAERPSLSGFRDLFTAFRDAPGLMRDGVGYVSRLRQSGVPILWSHVSTAATGARRVERVRVGRIGAAGEVEAESAHELTADALCLGYGFVASSELAQSLGCRMAQDPRHLGTPRIERSVSGETSVAGVFAVGDGAEVNGAVIAEASGTLAGLAAASQLGFDRSPAELEPRSRRKLHQATRFQRALWRLFAAPPVSLRDTPSETILCRCEGLTFGDIRTEIAAGWDTLATLKRRTRLGMGRCQARYCAPVAAHLLAEVTERPAAELATFAPRLPVKPFPAAAVALEKPEWGGHARAGSPNLARPVPCERVESQSADIVVIGGGVVGACLAYDLARAGQDVLLVERDDINLQASGNNAGSLHVQLLAFDFGAKAEAGGSPAVATLPLGPWAVALWQELAAACGGGFDLRLTGGLMVAEDEAGMTFLRSKAAVERQHGIAAEILGPKELRDLAPTLSEKLVGAEFVPLEGKINPLTATYRVFEAAKRAGARYFRSTDVEAISRDGSGFRLTTSRGDIRAGRIVNAAGPWARLVGEMVGIDVPVYSAPLQMIVTERAPQLVSQLVAFADRHLTMKQLSTGGIVIGGAWTADYDSNRRMNVTRRESIEGNLWLARRVLPQLDGLHVLRTWASMNVNIDGAPIIGEVPGVSGFYNAVTSNGYTLAPAIARLTRDLIVRGRTDRDVRPFLLDRFQ